MSRTLSLAARRGVFAQETAELYFVLLTISHPELAQPIRVVNDRANLSSRGDLFVGFPFRIHLPAEVEDRLVTVQVEIDNVDRAIGDAVRALRGRPTVRLEVVLASSPDVVEAGPWVFGLGDIEVDALTVRGTLGFAPLLDRRIPRDSQDPARFPGMFP